MKHFAVWFLALSALPALIWAEPPIPPKTAEAMRLAQAVNLDGKLDDPVWRQGTPVSGFIQKDPKEGTPASEKTLVWFAYDDEAFYVGARMHIAPEKIRCLVSRRDQAGISERIVVSLDTYLDRRTAYSFGITAAGTRIDYYHSSDDEYNRDYSYDPVWEAKTGRDSLGWTAEMRIPFSQLRFNAKDVQTWGFNLNRWVPALNEDDYYVYIPKNETGWSSRFASLNGIGAIKPSRRVEVAPYAASDATMTGDRDVNDPFDDGKNLVGRTGADVKVGLGPNLTLDAAVNPDFGQVEADPAVVNLSAFEITFNEKRPFFTEGSQLLQGNGPAYFYSRRIGAAPSGPASGDYVDRPKVSTILGATKLSGRLASGLSLGLLTAVTDEEFAKTYDAGTQTYGKTLIAPRAGFGVLRLQQEFGPSASTIGLSLTGMGRDLSGSRELWQRLTHRAFTGGTDWNIRFNKGEYVLSGSLGFSHVEGDSNAIRRIQTSSARYYQRPDADHVELDPSRTSLAGYQGALRFNKNGGKHWLWSASIAAESPGFELNDVGRLGSADDIDFFGSLRYRENNPGKIFRDYSLALYLPVGWNFGGTRQYTTIDFESNWTWKNFWSSFVGAEVFPRSLSDNLTRGGPLMKTGAGWSVHSALNSNQAANISGGTFVNYFHNELGAVSYYQELSFNLRSNGRWEFSAYPWYDRSRTARQFIGAFGGGPPETYGSRYVFSNIDQSTLATQFRFNYAFTPDLTLELYAEPFVASGRFHRFGELWEAEENGLRYYGEDGGTTLSYDDSTRVYTVGDGADTLQIDNPDFNILSFRSNVVMRWEWRRGSTLFLVWQQDRSGFEPIGNHVRPRQLFDAITSTGNNFFAVKISYWIPVS